MTDKEKDMCELDFEEETEEEHECGPDCDHDHEEFKDKIYLTLEDDRELVCDVLGIFEVDGKEYIAMVPEDGEEVFVYQFIEDKETEEFSLEVIEDQEEFDAVSDAFEEIFIEEDE